MKKNPQDKQSIPVFVRLTPREDRIVERELRKIQKKNPGYSKAQWFREGRAKELGL